MKLRKDEAIVTHTHIVYTYIHTYKYICVCVHVCVCAISHLYFELKDCDMNKFVKKSDMLY